MRVRWFVAALLFTGGMINYLDRAVLSVTAPLITRDLSLDTTELGWIFSSFFVGYVLFSFVGGQAADRWGAKRVLGTSMLAWSLFCGLTVLATGFWSLVVLRALFGLGEGPFNSTLNKSINNWFPARERGTAIGLTAAGQPLGGAIAGPIAGGAAAAWGWGAPFIIVAVIGLAWTLAWLLLVRDQPHKHPWVREEELAELAADLPATSDLSRETSVRPLGFYLRQKTVLGTAFAFFGFSYVIFFFLTWFPTYLVRAQGLDVKSMGGANVVPWLMGFVGLILGGLASDWVYRRTGRALFARKVVLVSGLVLTAICVSLAGLVTGLYSAVALMATALLALYATGNAYWAILQDTIPPARMGGVGGFVGMIATTSGIIGPAATGYLVTATGSFVSAFILAGVIALGAAAAVIFFVRPIAEEIQSA